MKLTAFYCFEDLLKKIYPACLLIFTTFLGSVVYHYLTHENLEGIHSTRPWGQARFHPQVPGISEAFSSAGLRQVPW